MISIRHIASPSEGADVFATGAFERAVCVWSLREKKKISQFDTILDFGGRRLAVVPWGRPMVVAGAYSGGVCAYDAYTGYALWHRHEIRNVQFLTASRVKSERILLGVGTDVGAFQIIDVNSGQTIDVLKGIRELYWSRLGIGSIQVAPREIAFSPGEDWKIVWRRTLPGPVLDVAMNRTAITISISGGGVLCYDVQGRNLWDWQPDKGHHVLSLCWHEQSRTWVGVCWCFETGGSRRLILLDECGRLLSDKDIDTPERPIFESAFLGAGEYLITSGGEVLTVPDLRPAWVFAKANGT